MSGELAPWKQAPEVRCDPGGLSASSASGWLPLRVPPAPACRILKPKACFARFLRKRTNPLVVMVSRGNADALVILPQLTGSAVSI